MLSNLIHLTDWETGDDVYVDPAVIVGVRWLAARVYEPIIADDVPHELGGRTRIDTKSDLLLVRETPAAILAKAKGETDE